MSDITTVLTGGTNSFQTTAEHLNYPATDFVNDGVIGVITNTSGVAPATGALAANAQGTPDRTVAVSAGVAYVTATPTGQASQRLRVNIAAQNVTHATNATGGTRYDWVYATINATNANTPNASGSNVVTLTVSRSTSAVTDNGTPPTYGLPLYVATLTNGYSTITNGNIADVRVRATTHARVADGWTPANETWTYASATTITVPTDATTKYSVGDRVKLSQGGAVKYFYIVGVASTVLTVTGGADYSLANSQIYNPQFSHQATPNGFPQWFAYTPTVTGFSSNPTSVYEFTVNGRMCTFATRASVAGTSNATTYTISAPITSATRSTQVWVGFSIGADNSSATTIVLSIPTASSTITLGKGISESGAWTASGSKYVNGMLSYEI